MAIHSDSCPRLWDRLDPSIHRKSHLEPVVAAGSCRWDENAERWGTGGFLGEFQDILGGSSLVKLFHLDPFGQIS